MGVVMVAVATAGAADPGAGGRKGVQAAEGIMIRPDRTKQIFDLQAHRGGIGLRPESSPSAFGYALELGVSTLELDVQINAGRPGGRYPRPQDQPAGMP
jgi:glycerophosphoryl diester phosphodiesterase